MEHPTMTQLPESIFDKTHVAYTALDGEKIFPSFYLTLSGPKR
jgi:hypothetical protein